MFQSVRPNTVIYILHKGNTPKLETGFVCNTPMAKPKYAVPPSFGQTQEMIVDLTVKIGDKSVNFNGLNAQSEIADTWSGGEQIVIALNKEAMNAEILSLKQKSVDAINMVETHKTLIDEYEKMLTELNPEYAEKQAQQEEMSSLKQQVADLTKSIGDLLANLKNGGLHNENVGN